LGAKLTNNRIGWYRHVSGKCAKETTWEKQWHGWENIRLHIKNKKL
jgi:hypothetical protein